MERPRTLVREHRVGERELSAAGPVDNNRSQDGRVMNQGTRVSAVLVEVTRSSARVLITPASSADATTLWGVA